MNIGQSAGKAYAYLLGVYLGDGCVTTSGYTSIVFRLNTIDLDFAEATATALKDVTGRRPNIRKETVKKGRDNYAMSHSCRELTDVLVADTCNKKIIPEYVFKWSDENKKAFVSGLMDSEGFVAQKANCPTGRRFYMGFKSCDLWVRDFVRLLQSVGVKVGKVSTEKPRKPGYKTPTRFLIKMASWVSSGCKFNIARKQNRVDEWAATEPYSQRRWRPRKATSETNMQSAL